MNFVSCSHEQHAQAILEIFNDAILNSTALYDYKPRAPESMVGWFKTKEAGGFPVIGIENENNELMGFASYGTFRAWPAYKYSVEHSVYLKAEHRGKGLGNALMNKLIEAARAPTSGMSWSAVSTSKMPPVSRFTASLGSSTPAQSSMRRSSSVAGLTWRSIS